MSGDILIKVLKNVACGEWGWVAGRVVSFCNLDIAKVGEFSSCVSARMLSLVTVSEEGSDSNMMTNYIFKAPSKSIYIYHNIITSVKNSEIITQKFLRPTTNHWYFTCILE